MTITRVLLLSGDVADELGDAGFDVVRCHEPGDPAFPCIGLAGGTCPLDLAGGVDVAVDLWGTTDAGLTCALRAEVPVVTDAGTDLLQACEDAMSEALEPLRAAVGDAAAAVLAHQGIDDAPIAVRVVRRQQELDIRIAAPTPSARVRGMVATRAAVAARRHDDAARRVSIEVVEPAFV